MKDVQKDSTRGFMVLMTDATDHVTGLAGLTLTITLSKEGGAYGSSSASVTDRGDGNYWISPVATDRDTYGENNWHITATGADPWDGSEEVVAFDHRSENRGTAGNALPNAAADSAGGLPISDSGGLDLDTLLGRLDASISSRVPSTSLPTNFSLLGINALGQVLTVVSNLDMRGTDNAALSTELAQTEIDIINAVNAVNTGVARYITISTSPNFERPESGTRDYQIEITTFDGNGERVNPDGGVITLTATRVSDGTDLSSKLTGPTNPIVGTNIWIYELSSTDDIGPLRLQSQAIISATARIVSVYPNVTDADAADFTTSDRNMLASVFSKLPTATYLLGTANSDGSGYSTHLPSDVVSAMQLVATDFQADVSGLLTTSTYNSSLPTNFTSLSIDSLGVVDSFIQGFLSHQLVEPVGGRITDNFETFIYNGGNLTSKIVDDVGTGSGSGVIEYEAW